jgi:DNA-binding CsgD family transcriptional regulator
MDHPGHWVQIVKTKVRGTFVKLETEDPSWSAIRSSRRSESALFFERSQFLQEFESIFGRTVPSHSGCLSIEGGWGTGKTTLLNEACLIADRSSCLVLRARGGDLEQHASFGALLRIIEVVASLRNADDEVSERVEAVCALINKHGERNFGQLGAAFYSLLIAVRRLGPVLLAIDDADLVDDATLMTLQYVFHRVDDQQIWLLVTSPPRLPGVGPRVVDHLLVNRHVRHFILKPLNPESVRAILSGYLDQVPEPEFVDAVFDATNGRPEFVVELAKACAHEHVAPTDKMAGELSRLPVPRISQRVLVRLERLQVAATELLECCAIHGNTTDLGLACHLGNLDPVDAELAADVSSRAEILQGGRPLAFIAPIVRWALLQDIPPARRSQLHTRCAQYLSESDADESAVVEHLLASEPSGNPELASRLARAGRTLIERSDYRLASQCLRRSINEGPVSMQEASIWLDLARCETQLGLRTSVSSFQRALSLGAPNNTEVFEVAIKLMRALRSWPELRVEAVASLNKLNANLGDVDPALQLEFEMGLTLLANHPGQRSDGVSKIRTLLKQSDTSAEVSSVARAFLDIHRFESDPKMSAKTIAEMLGSVVDRDQMIFGDLSSEMVQTRACRILLGADEFATVDRILETGRQRALSIGDLPGEDDMLRLVVLSKLWQGALSESEEALQRHHELGNTYNSRPVVGLVDLLVAQGRTQEAMYQLGSFDPERFDEPLDRATAHVERGRLFSMSNQCDEALDEFERAGETAARAGITNPVLVAWHPPAARVLASLGHWDEAHQLAEDHLVSARAFGARRTLGTALRAMGASSRDLDERTAWLQESVDVLEGSPARLEAAEAMIDLGSVLVDRQDTEKARDILHKGATLASLCGAQRLVELAGSQLRAAGARPRRLGSTGVDSLTPAELRAVHMAAANVTNRAIADELFVNVKTIEGHLSRAYRKLGVTSRFELAEALGPRGRYEASENSENARTVLP